MAVVSGVVNMSVTTSMAVVGNSHITTTPLVDQIAALAGQDPALLGATGYADDVFTTRLAGDIN
jgi:hypothetical protein